MARYRKRISGPLLDRIDIHLLCCAPRICDITVPRVDYEKLSGDRLRTVGGHSARVEKARAKQQQRFAGSVGANGHSSLQVNADMGPAEVREYCGLDESGKQLIRAAMMTLHHTQTPIESRVRDEASEAAEPQRPRVSPHL